MIYNMTVAEWATRNGQHLYHAVLCDPPYHLTEPISMRGAACGIRAGRKVERTDEDKAARRGGFMGKKWDGGDIAFNPETWQQIASHMHDGAFLMAFASSRGWHRMACAIEDAGFIIHPTIFGWAFGSGFPKATRIDTQVDKAAGAEHLRKVVGTKHGLPGYSLTDGEAGGVAMHGNVDGSLRNGAAECAIIEPATPLAAAWAGHRYGLQALKPAVEPIIVAQKPYKGKPVDCITRTGAGALWIDGGRIWSGTEHMRGNVGAKITESDWKNKSGFGKPFKATDSPLGRWPANFILYHLPECKRTGTKRVKGAGWRDSDKRAGAFAYGGMATNGKDEGPQHYADPDGLETVEAWDCSEGCPVAALDRQSGETGNGYRKNPSTQSGSAFHNNNGAGERGHNDSGGASRFFYNVQQQIDEADPIRYQAKASRRERDAGLDGGKSNHPTHKPIDLARYLATLLLPPKEYAPRKLLVPFSGVGSEMIGALLAGWEQVDGIEAEKEYVEIAEKRIAYHSKKSEQLELIPDKV